MSILEFKTRQQQFEEWFEEVRKVNFEGQEIKSALFIWELSPTKDGFIATHCKFNCPLDQLKWFHRELGNYIRDREFDEYLRNHIQEYIEFI